MSTGLTEPLAPDIAEAVVCRFHRDGYSPVLGVLSQLEVDELRAAADAVFADPIQKEKHKHGFDFVIARLYEGPQIFQDLIKREPIYGLVSAVLGNGCDVVGYNVIRNQP